MESGLLETNKRTKMGKLGFIKSLSENVGNIIMCIDIGKLKVTSIDTLTEEMMFDVKVFASGMKRRVVRQYYCTIIVAQNISGTVG
jgi:hypothetical protein